MSTVPPFWHAFRTAYAECAEQSLADSVGSTEYCRVFEEWTAAGCPPGVRSFIITHANAEPRRIDPDDAGKGNRRA